MALCARCRTGDSPELRIQFHLFFCCLIILHNKVERHESRLIYWTLANVTMVLITKWCRINIRTRKVRGVCSACYLVPPGAIIYTLGAPVVYVSDGTLINEYFTSCLCLVVSSCHCRMLWF